MSFSEWKTYQLEELIDLKSGKSRPKEVGEYPVYGGNGILDYTNQFNVSDETIIIGRVGAYCGSIYFENKKIWISDNALFAKAKNGNSAKFLYYYLKDKNLNRFAGGSSHPLLTQGQLNEIEVEVPSEKTQQRIASILSSLDDAIELNQQINKTLEEMAKAIFKEWFVDFNFPNATGKFQETEIGKIPVGWKVGTIESILFHSKNSVNPSKQPDEDFYHYSIPAYDEGNNPSVEKGSTILSNKFQVKSNSILVSKLNPRFPRTWAIGEIEEERSICSTEFQVLVPRKPFYYSFGLWVFAQTFVIDKMKGNATGTSGSHQRVRPQDILDIEIALPNDDILKLYHDTVSAFSKQIDDNKKENQSLINLRDTLLPKLMKGEIEING